MEKSNCTHNRWGDCTSSEHVGINNNNIVAWVWDGEAEAPLKKTRTSRKWKREGLVV
jgi:hypothetical protein